MEATYERILDTINAKPRPQRELARSILIWIAYTRKPLPIDALAYAISIEMDTKSLEDLESSTPTEESIVSACGNLVSVDRSGARCVRFVHFSLQEFLTSHRSTTISMECDIGHREIGQACMVFLTLYHKQSDLLASDNSHKWLYEYARDEWPHHLLAGKLNSLLVGDLMVTLTLLFFDKGPVLLAKEHRWQGDFIIWGNDRVYFKFSPAVLALIFNLPSTQECQSLCRKQPEKEQPEAVYNKDLNGMVIYNDKLAIHYATAELDSVSVVRRLYTHGYTLDYCPRVGSNVQRWLQLSPLYSVQSTKMARYLLENGISIEPQVLSGVHTLADPLKYFSQRGNWGIEVFRILLDRAVDHDEEWQERLEDALQTAVLYANMQAIHLLLDKGVNVNAQGGEFGNALRAAIHKDNVIRLLLDKGADPNAPSGKGYGNALQAAVFCRQINTVRLFLSKGADINAQDPDLLYIAACRDDIKIIRLLLDNGANVNAQGGYYGNALQAAVCCSKIGIVQLLLDKGSNVNAQGGQFGNALLGAVFMGKVKFTQLLLDKGADVNSQNVRYGNALQMAVYRGGIEIIRLLLDYGANVNAQGGYYGNALQTAAYHGKIEVTRLLLDKGADVNAQDVKYGSALQTAAYRGETEVIRLLLDQGADINAQGGEYGSALQAATYRGKAEVIQLLLDKGAKVDAQNGDYGNALQTAVFEGKVEVIQLLLDKGADSAKYGDSLLLAAYRGEIEIARLLLDKGADVNTQHVKYGNALYAASLKSNVELVRLLLDSGADVNAQGGTYGNALQTAVYQGTVDVIRLLLEKGADVNAQGGMFGTALQAAAYNGTIEVIQLLLDNGADIYARGGKYGAALDKILALKPTGAGMKVPGDIPLLIELVHDHVPILMEYVPQSEYEALASKFLNDKRCDLDVFRKLLESRGRKCGNQSEDGSHNVSEDEIEESGTGNETSEEIQLKAPNENRHVRKLFGLTFLVFLLYILSGFWGV